MTINRDPDGTIEVTQIPTPVVVLEDGGAIITISTEDANVASPTTLSIGPVGVTGPPDPTGPIDTDQTENTDTHEIRPYDQ